MSAKSTEAIIVDLQSRVAYQEDSLNALSDELARHQQRIEQLTVAMESLTHRISGLPVPGDDAPEPPPPHY